ncbi:MAG: hupD1 [Actinomycetia bacterium]|jgi:hydrogenase maturation protease|nr:hupD1 [Actinomycetes bacterium]
MTGKVLVAGIGNIFFGDDGFGVEVAGRLATRPRSEAVRVADFGIRSVHLAYELLDGYDTLVLIDAVPMGEAPGTVAVLEPEIDVVVAGSEPSVDAHSMDPVTVLTTLAGLGGSVDRVLVVGCQPGVMDEGIGLSQPVAEAVDRAVDAIEDLLIEIRPTAGKERGS